MQRPFATPSSASSIRDRVPPPCTALFILAVVEMCLQATLHNNTGHVHVRTRVPLTIKTQFFESIDNLGR